VKRVLFQISAAAALFLFGLVGGCAHDAATDNTPKGWKPPPAVARPSPAASNGSPSTTASALHMAPDIPQRLAQLPRTSIDYDHSLLDSNETAVVQKLIEASRLIDQIYLLQVSEKNPERRRMLSAAPQNGDALQFFDINKGPWDRVKDDEPFIVEAGPKPKGAGFYPEDIKKEEIEAWIAAHPGDKDKFQGLFTVIRRENGGLTAIPYSKFYHDLLLPASERLHEAAALTKNASLRDFLNTRAEAFLTDDYYKSDFAWMDLNSDIEVVIGPYEVYEDNLFNYKAAFESFVNVVDKPESAKLAAYAQHLPDLEKNLPIPDEFKNPNRGTDSPIRVVQEIYTAGDARRGVQTAAFNLPNDERVREAKGSKKVLLKNVMDAKFRQSGKPVALRVLDPVQQNLISFDAYFNQILFHELSHGLGPGIIVGPDGKKVEARILLKNLYSSIEECKADVLGVWNIEYAIDHNLLSNVSRDQLFVTDTALMFRSMRFGLGEAHGRGTAVQWNWYREKGAIVPTAAGRFHIDLEKMPEAVRSLANELLMIEAKGDFERGRRLLDTYGVTNPEIKGVIARLNDIPVDITPVFVGAGEK
jgi:hypothetical protein